MINRDDHYLLRVKRKESFYNSSFILVFNSRCRVFFLFAKHIIEIVVKKDQNRFPRVYNKTRPETFNTTIRTRMEINRFPSCLFVWRWERPLSPLPFNLHLILSPVSTDQQVDKTVTDPPFKSWPYPFIWKLRYGTRG